MSGAGGTRINKTNTHFVHRSQLLLWKLLLFTLASQKTDLFGQTQFLGFFESMLYPLKKFDEDEDELFPPQSCSQLIMKASLRHLF